MRINPVQINDILPSTNLASSITGIPVSIESAFGFCMIMAWTGSPVGTFFFQVSNSIQTQASLIEPSSWVTDTETVLAITAAGNQLYNFNTYFPRWIRLCWTATSGSGTITDCRFNSKGE